MSSAHYAPVSVPTLEAIIRLMRQGLDTVDIARKYGCRESYVWNVLVLFDGKADKGPPQ